MEYLESFERAIIYMEQHLDERISVHEVAKEAGYSYYHFTRIFQSMLGESVGNYIQKRRLSNASQKLLYTEEKIIDIAIESGFDSSQAFSRAFKRVYQVSPSAYRQHRLNVFLGNKTLIDHDYLHHISSHITIQPKIVTIAEIHIIGIRSIVSLDNIFPLWEKFHTHLDTIPKYLRTSRTFGICEYREDLPVANYDMDLTEVIGVEVTSCEDVPSDMIIKTIPAGKYAVFTHKGSLQNLLKTYQYIWGTWAVLTDETIAYRDDFELYDERFIGKYDEQSEIDIYIPIQ